MNATTVLAAAVAGSIALAAGAAPATVEDPAPRAAKVWTAADLARLRGPRVNVVGTAPAAVTQAGESDASVAVPPGVTGPDPAEEPAWRAEALALDDRIAQLARRIAYLQAVDESWESLALGARGYEAAAASKLTEVREEIAAAERDLAQARGEKVLLEERARKSGVPPGWLR